MQRSISIYIGRIPQHPAVILHFLRRIYLQTDFFYAIRPMIYTVILMEKIFQPRTEPRMTLE